MTQAVVCGPRPARRGRPRKDAPRPPLTEDERARRNELVLKNLPLVVFWARRFLPRVGRKLDMDDLVQEGRLGLMRAAEDFDPALGHRFSTYASCWIQQSMRRAMRAADLVRVPEYARTDNARWLERRAALASERGGGPADADVDAALQLKPVTAECLAAARRAFRGARRVPPQARDRNAPGPVEAAALAEEIALLRRAVARLSPRKREVVELWLEGVPLHQIGRRLGMGKGAASQMAREAVIDIRAALIGGPSSVDQRRAREKAAALAAARQAGPHGPPPLLTPAAETEAAP